MIIKCHRVRTRGSARQRLVQHLMNGDNNEEVRLLRGTLKDVEDAFADARRLGREYAVRHWILSPSHEVVDDQLISAVQALGREFQFDPDRAIVIQHRKTRASEGAFDRHLHVLVPEVDPVTNSVLSSSHSFPRNEKVARILEAEWGHPFTSGAHNVAVIATLRANGQEALADALERAFLSAETRPRQAFNFRDQQRLKREGFDLPALRLVIAEAWTTKTSHEDFVAALQSHGLSVQRGQKPDTYLVQNASGDLIGALHRLIRLRKDAVRKYMEGLDAGAHESNDRASDLPQHTSDPAAAAADRNDGRGQPEPGPAEPAGDVVGRAASDVGGDSAASAGAGTDSHFAQSADHRAGRARHAKEELASSETLRLALALQPQFSRLHELLAIANSLARNNSEQVTIELGAIEERAHRARAAARTRLPEPRSLLDARTAFQVAVKAVLERRQRLDQIESALASLRQPQPFWRRAVNWLSGAAVQRQSQIAAAAGARRQAEIAVRQAEEARAQKDQALRLAKTQYSEAVREHAELCGREAVASAQRLAMVKSTLDLWQLLPGISNLGIDTMCRLGGQVAKFQGRRVRPLARRGYGVSTPSSSLIH